MPYTYTQLEQLWISAGGNTSAAPTAAAVALAESSGNQSATNQNTNGTTDYGLWQINSAHFGEAGIPDSSLIVANPSYNAQAAVSIFNAAGQQFTPWVAYNTGAYKQYLQGGSDWMTQTTGSAAAGTPSQSIGVQPTGFTYVAQSSTNAANLFKNWLTNSGTNSLYIAFVAGFIVVVLSLIKPTSKFAPWVGASLLFLILIQQGQSSSTQVISNSVGAGPLTNQATASYA